MFNLTIRRRGTSYVLARQYTVARAQPAKCHYSTCEIALEIGHSC